MTAQSLVARRIGTLPFTTVASPEYLRRFGVPQHPRELEEGGHHMVNFFSPRTGRMFTDDFEKDGESIALASNYRIAVNESNAYLAAALAGLGVVCCGLPGREQGQVQTPPQPLALAPALAPAVPPCGC